MKGGSHRCLLSIALLGAGCTTHRTALYEHAHLAPATGRNSAPTSGACVVLELETSVGLPFPDAVSTTRLWIELTPADLETGRELSLTSADVHAVLTEGRGAWHAPVRGFVSVLRVSEDGVLVRYYARCPERDWKEAGRDWFALTPLPAQRGR